MKTPLLASLFAGLVLLSGCIAGDDDTDPGTSVTDMPVEAPTGPIVENLTGSFTYAVGTPLVSVNNGPAYAFDLPRDSPNITGYVIELTWDPTTPTAEQLDLWIRHLGDFAIPPSDPTLLPSNLVDNQPLHRATGTSPLRLAFAADTLDPEEPYQILVRAQTPVGVAVEQAFDLKLAIFDGVALDDAFAFA